MNDASNSLNSAKCQMPNHHVVVATKPGEPGAYASCVDEPEWLASWAVERLLEGGVLQRVHCDRAHTMLLEYQAWCDRQDNAKAELKSVTAHVDARRKMLLMISPPRSECPGCFSAIYDGAAEQGWCCNCFDPVKNKPRY